MLARRLPSLGVGAWRSAPLLPWRVQCPVRVCVALAAGSGGSGRYLVLCLSNFPLPAPRVPRCVWRAVPSGCPLPSPAGTPFHAVCAFCGLGPVALLVVPACPHPPLWGSTRTPPPPPGARGAGRSTHLPANTGGHRRYGGPPGAAPPDTTRRPPGAQGPGPRPRLGAMARRVGRVAPPPPLPMPVDGRRALAVRG